MSKLLWKLFLAVAVVASIAIHGCDKLNNGESIFEDEVATSSEGGKAVVDNILLITDIGLALTDTSRFGAPTLARKVATHFRRILADTCILDTSTEQWTCTADYELAGGIASAQLLVEFQKNIFNGYPYFGPPTNTDTANIVLTVTDSFDVSASREIFVDVSGTQFEITGFKDWMSSATQGALVFNGSLNFNARAEVGRNTPGVSGDDVTFDITYQQTLTNVTVNEGSTVPSSGTVGFVIDQDVTPNPDGVLGIAADFQVTGSITFTSSSITMTINGHSYSVTIAGDGTVTITPI